MVHGEGGQRPDEGPSEFQNENCWTGSGQRGGPGVNSLTSSSYESRKHVHENSDLSFFFLIFRP